MADKGNKRYRGFYMRLSLLIFTVLMAAVGIVYNLYKTIVVQGDFWRGHASVLKNDTVTVYSPRGNIYDCNGNLLVSSLPKYRVFVDFGVERLVKMPDARSKKNEKNLVTFKRDLDSLCIHLSEVFHCDKNILKERMLAEVSKPSDKRNRRYSIIGTTEIDHSTQIALFDSKFVKDYRCFYTEKRIKREKPFSTLSSRALGGVYGDAVNESKGGNSGLELFYNSELKGLTGLARKQRVKGRNHLVSIVEPKDGCDLITTFDVKMMDIVENELKRSMRINDVDHACAVVMEVKSGEVKAMSNLDMNSDGDFYEMKNHAVSSLTEPGSTFKVASVMALLESGRADTSYKIDTGNGLWQLRNWDKPMRDHNWKHGGYGEISLAQAIWYSSNIGIAKPITELFGLSRDSSAKFVDRLYSMKLNEELKLEIPGQNTKPKIPHPTDASVDWSGMSLPWMSTGYGVQVPPIYTLTFYNGIANGGKMVKPVFVKSIVKDGRVQRTMATEVLNSKLCSNSTLNKVKDMLRGVVLHGTGKTANSHILKLAGKSGTAQQYTKNVKTGYQYSFCGYFPADAPQYSCIVVLWVNGNREYISEYPCKTFGKIAERIYALGEKNIVRPAEDERTVPYLPRVKTGKTKELKYALDKLDLNVNTRKADAEWSSVETGDSTGTLKAYTDKKSLVPDVIGWGAKDAVYMLENKGLRVSVHGRGRVVQQSIAPGSAAVKGSTINIVLKN